jgi:drug/metabolite transporter (DMT)-like permease
MSPRLLLAFLVVYLVWGSTYFAITFVVDVVPPMLAMGTRFVLAGGVLMLLGRVRGEALPTFGQWRWTALVGGLLFVLGNGSIAWAESRGLATGTAALLVATVPLWMTLLARLRGERTSLPALVGLAIGFLGTALLVNPDAGAPLPALAVMLGAGGWALGSLLARELDLPKGGRMAAGAQMLAGGVLMIAVGLARGELLPAAHTITLAAVLGWLYLVVLGSVIGFSAYSYLLRNVAPSKLGTYAYVNPVVAMLLGVLIGEPIDTTMICAMALVLGGVAVTVATRRAPSGRTLAPLPLAAAAKSAATR